MGAPRGRLTSPHLCAALLLLLACEPSAPPVTPESGGDALPRGEERGSASERQREPGGNAPGPRSGARAESALGDVVVELDAYSGRPNPVWTLTAEEARDLSARLASLREADAASLPEATLGYRGFSVRNPRGEGGIPAEVYVARGGLVRVTDVDGRTRILVDTGVEAWLIEAARRRGHGDIFP